MKQRPLSRLSMRPSGRPRVALPPPGPDGGGDGSESLYSPLVFSQRTGRPLRVNVMSETSRFKMTDQGGHTAFLDCVDLMSRHPDLEILVNSREPCDVLHSHSWGPFYVSKGLAYKGRRVFTVHALPETAEGALPFMGPMTRPIVRAYMKAIYNFSDVVIAVAPATARSLCDLRVRARIETIPNALREDRFFPSRDLRREGRALLGVAGSRPLVLGVGQVQPRKGIADFAEVARSLPGADFIWVGGRPFGAVSAGLFELRRLQAHPPQNLKFAGPFELTQMPRVYNAADAMLFPSLQENCPYAPMEAASCGLPVVFRDLAAYSLLYPSEFLAASDAAGFSRLLREILESPSHWKLWSQASIRLAAHFSSAAFIESLARVYDRIGCERLGPC
jgi:1,2-diacylglycerol-3-alpha-glucose alpha-1,2-galactosyltransferase